MSAPLKLCIGALCTVLFELCCGHLLESFKIKRQTTALSVAQIYASLTAKRGVLGLWDGFLPWGLLMALSKGASFSFAHQFALNALSASAAVRAVASPTALNIAASALGGLFQGVVMSPLLLLKTRVITHSAFRELEGGLWATARASLAIGRRVVAAEGALALCKGMRVFAAKRLCDWLTRFAFVELAFVALRSLGVDARATVARATAVALFGGTLSALSTTLLDVCTALIQHAERAGDDVGLRSLVAQMRAQKGGLGAATKGIYWRVAHVATTTVVMKNTVPAVCDAVLRWQLGGIGGGGGLKLEM